MQTAIILVIDTALPETVVLLLRNDQPVGERRSAAVRRADDLLPLIDQVIKEANMVLGDLSAIVVRRGLGSYTGLRVGVTVANTFAWSLPIPVIGVVSRTPVPLTLQQIRRTVKKSDLRPPTSDLRPVFPKYGRWPDAGAPARLNAKQ